MRTYSLKRSGLSAYCIMIKDYLTFVHRIILYIIMNSMNIIFLQKLYKNINHSSFHQ